MGKIVEVVYQIMCRYWWILLILIALTAVAPFVYLIYRANGYYSFMKARERSINDGERLKRRLAEIQKEKDRSPGKSNKKIKRVKMAELPHLKDEPAEDEKGIPENDIDY